MTKEEFKIILIFSEEKAQKIIEKALVGKTFKAFGLDSGSYWRKRSEEKKFTIKAVNIHYVDKAKYNFFSLDIFPKDYDSKKDFLYTDDKFESEIQKALPFLHIVFSEQGLQGGNYANFDVSLNIE